VFTQLAGKREIAVMATKKKLDNLRQRKSVCQLCGHCSLPPRCSFKLGDIVACAGVGGQGAGGRDRQSDVHNALAAARPGVRRGQEQGARGLASPPSGNALVLIHIQNAQDELVDGQLARCEPEIKEMFGPGQTLRSVCCCFWTAERIASVCFVCAAIMKMYILRKREVRPLSWAELCATWLTIE
jgi:hypothetical protein